MLEQLLHPLILIVTASIDHFGNYAVTALMALESANIPIPSEAILTYAGYLASKGLLNWHLAAFAGAVGCIIGGSVSYYIGLKLGRPFLMKYGKWFLLSPKDIEFAEKFLSKYGEATYFISRLLPVIRTFIAFVVGISRGNFWRFNLYSFIGSWIWSYILVYIGLKLGDNWDTVKPFWDKFSAAIILIIIISIVWHIKRVFSQPKIKPFEN
ncbi:MAG: DedA family protein [bacterium]